MSVRNCGAWTGNDQRRMKINCKLQNLGLAGQNYQNQKRERHGMIPHSKQVEVPLDRVGRAQMGRKRMGRRAE